MTTTLETAPQIEADILPELTVLAAIQTRLAEIHTEPKGRHELITSALMLGSAATRSQIQV